MSVRIEPSPSFIAAPEVSMEATTILTRGERRMVTLFVGIGWFRKKRPAYAGEKITCEQPPIVHDHFEIPSTISLKCRPR